MRYTTQIALWCWLQSRRKTPSLQRDDDFLTNIKRGNINRKEDHRRFPNKTPQMMWSFITMCPCNSGKTNNEWGQMTNIFLYIHIYVVSVSRYTSVAASTYPVIEYLQVFLEVLSQIYSYMLWTRNEKVCVSVVVCINNRDYFSNKQGRHLMNVRKENMI